MDVKRWTDITGEKIPEGPLVHFAGVLSEGKSPRILRSESGSVVLVVERQAADECPDLTIELKKTVLRDTTIGLVVGGEELVAGMRDELSELARVCDLIACPNDLEGQSPPGLTTCGRLLQQLDKDCAETWCVLGSESSARDNLTRGAPTGGGEASDNLDSREKWFQKRHGAG